MGGADTTTPTDPGSAPASPRQRKQRYGDTARAGAIWSLVRRGGQEFVAVPTSFIMARLLAPQDFGVAAAASFFILLATRLTQFGFNAALVRVKDLKPEHTASVFALNLALGVLVFGTLVAAAPWVGVFFNSQDAARLLPHAALIFLITPFMTVPSALIARRMQFRAVTVTDWADALVGAVVSLLMAFRGYGFWSLVYGQLTGTLVRAILKIYITSWRPSLAGSREALRELLSFGLGVQTKRLMEFATHNLDTLVVGRILGLSSLGVYDKAVATTNRIVTRLTVGDVYFRIFAIIQEEPARFRRAYTRLVLSVSMLSLPAFTTAIVVARPLFLLLYGDQWTAAVPAFQLLCLAGALKLFNAYASQANEAIGNIWPQARRQGFGSFAIIAGALAGAKLWGITGAAAGVVLGMVILTWSIQSLVLDSTGLSWEEMLRPQIPALICSGLIALSLLTVRALLSNVSAEPAAALILALQAVTAALVYAAFVLFSRFAMLNEIVTDSIHQTMPAPVAAWLTQLRTRARPRFN